MKTLTPAVEKEPPIKEKNIEQAKKEEVKIEKIR